MVELERAFIFADLSGYTALTEAHGDEDAAQIAERFFTLVRLALTRTSNALLLKTLGDGVMIVAEDVGSGLELVRELHHAIDDEPGFPRMRVGLHTGTAVMKDGDYFGAAVNLCSRIAAQAWPGSIVCSEQVARVGDGRSGFEFKNLGSVELKNVRDPVLLFEVVITDRPVPSGVVDPVCRMHVEPTRAVLRQHRGSVLYFCSVRCAEEFDRAPERYTREEPQ